MPMDFRWHAFTVIAVFLAFGVGIVIGVALPQERVLLEKQQALIQRLEDEFGRLRQENRSLTRTVEQLRAAADLREDAVAGLAVLAVAGRLYGRTVWVAEWGSVPGAVRRDLVETLRKAGAEVAVGRVDLGAAGTGSGTVQHALTGVVRLYEPPGPGGVDGIVLVHDGAAAGAAELDRVRAWIEALQAGGLQVVVAETRGAQVSHVDRFRQLPVATVDAVDDATGRATVVFALLGAQGHFGFKDSADRLLPSVDEALPAASGPP